MKIVANIRFKKEKISVENIGKQRFWTGIFVGIISAIVLSLTFNYSREFLRIWTAANDLFILPAHELRFYNYFYAFLSALLGLSLAIWIWMNNRTHQRRKDKMLKQLARTNILLIFWTVIMLIARFGTNLTIILFWQIGYDNELNFYEEYWFVPVLVLIVIFLQNWFIVRLVYRAEKWIIYSLLACILATPLLVQTTTINQKMLNDVYFKTLEVQFSFIEIELERVKKLYNIEFDEKTVATLKKNYTNSSLQQVKDLKKAFSEEEKLSLEQIILQKIVIHNCKSGERYLYGRRIEPMKNWYYAKPMEVYRQMTKFDADAPETKELFGVLQEQILCATMPRVYYEDRDKYSSFEIEKRRFFHYYMPKQIRKELETAIDSVKANRSLEPFHELIQ
ncbi:MAG: hypothetical protein ACPG5B_05200 [Chitinophagales bacterium]